jgi:hypothetical protein
LQLFMDCGFGLGGDMFIAGLAGLGCDFAPLEGMFCSAGIDVSIEIRSERRGGLAGMRADVRWTGAQPLRHAAQLEQVITALDITPAVRGRAVNAVHRLAEAEGAVHGIDPREVHFHEVGAVDTLVDIVGAFWGLERLNIDTVVCSPLPWFSGTVCCEHGIMPLPAPATAVLMQGKPVTATAFREELITPTGALIVDSAADRFADGPEGVLLRGASAFGSRPEGGPLRLFLIEPQSHRHDDIIYTLETHIDHLTGEELGHAFDALLQAGALDVLFTPGVMKKNRPGGALTVLCSAEHLAVVEEAVIHHTHTLGLRRSRSTRVVLPRGKGTVQAGGHAVAAKEYAVQGRDMSRAEYEALAALARRTGRSLPELRMMLSGGDEDAD